MNRHFPKEGIEMANKHMERCLPSLIFRETKVKTTMRYHLTPAKMAVFKKNVITMSNIYGYLISTQNSAHCIHLSHF